MSHATCSLCHQSCTKSATCYVQFDLFPVSQQVAYSIIYWTNQRGCKDKIVSCASPNKDFNQIENWKCHKFDFRLIPLDCITYFFTEESDLIKQCLVYSKMSHLVRHILLWWILWRWRDCILFDLFMTFSMTPKTVLSCKWFLTPSFIARKWFLT